MAKQILFWCSKCHARLRVSTRLAGRPGFCPRCGQLVVIPPCVPSDRPAMLVFDDAQPAPLIGDKEI